MRHYAWIFILTSSLLATGCMVGPTYNAPNLEELAANKWQAALPHQGKTEQLVNFWHQFDDPALFELINVAQKNSTTLAQSLIRMEYARTLTKARYADLLPIPSIVASQTKSHSEQAMMPPLTQTVSQIGLSVNWEVDLFGAKRAILLQAQTQYQANQIDWHAARISLSAEVASTYTYLRTCEAQTQLLAKTIDSYKTTALLQQKQEKAGFISKSDLLTIEASIQQMQDTMLSQKGQCDILVKSLVALTNMPENDLRELLKPGTANISQSKGFAVNTIPTQVLAQRPDLAITERRLAIASYKINEKEAERYPRLSLLGNIGFGNLSFSGQKESTSSWSFGPSLTIPLLDIPVRKYAAKGAELDYQEAVEGYKQSVRTAIKEVEEALVNLDTANKRQETVSNMLTQYQNLLITTEKRYKAGFNTQLDLENVRRQYLNAEITKINLTRDQALTWITLYRVVGGDWHIQQTQNKHN